MKRIFFTLFIVLESCNVFFGSRLLDVISLSEDSNECVTRNIPSSRVILFGENHYMNDENNDIKIGIITNALKKDDTLKILIEAGHAEAYLMNKYLNIGDTQIINNGCYNSEYLYDLNTYLISFLKNNNKEIVYYGIDYERNSAYTLFALSVLLENMPDSLFKNISKNEIRNSCEYLPGKKKEVISYIFSIFKNNESLFRILLKNEFHDFKNILISYNKYERKEILSKHQFNIERENWLYNSIIRHEKMDNFQILVFLGSAHCSYSRIFKKFDSVAMMLKSSNVNIFSIHLCYNTNKPLFLQKKLGFSDKLYSDLFSHYQTDHLIYVSTECSMLLNKIYYHYCPVNFK
jgi:hypothetical protein